MGPIETFIAIIASWAVVALVFVAGFVVGRFGTALAGEKKVIISRRLPGKLPVQSPVTGVDVNKEREAIVQRAKKEFNMTPTQAEKFADEIVKQGVKELGRLHSTG